MKLTTSLTLFCTASLFVLLSCSSKKQETQEPTVWTNNGVDFFVLNPDSTYVEYELEIDEIDYAANSATKKKKENAHGSYRIVDSKIEFTDAPNSYGLLSVHSPLSINESQLCYFDSSKGRICFDKQ